jgi:hypothetical protein
MNKLVTVTSIAPIGCTFLDWSIHYLSSAEQYFIADDGWVPISDNPLSNLNAHQHLKNHPSGLAQTKQVLEKIKSTTDLVTVYPYPLHIDLAAKQANIDVLNVNENVDLIHQILGDDYIKTLKFLYENNSKIIFLSLDESMNLYTTEFRTLGPLLHNSDILAKNESELRKSFDNVFYSDKESAWGTFDNKWDLRERLALDYRPLKKWNPKMDFSLPHFWVDSREWWFNGQETIERIMDYVEIPIDSTRYDNWLKVYYQWQKIQLKNTKFAHEYKHIVDSIVNGWDYKIDLSFNQEVVIQHCLIYQHNLNLKTWQLDKFPDNTKKLHDLLESNIHPLNCV